MRGGPLAGDLRRYKSDRAATAEAEAAAARLRELLAAFLADRGRVGLGGAGMTAGPTAVAVVPSGQGRPGAHPLAGVVRSCVDLPMVRLSVVPGEMHSRGVNSRWVRVGDPVAGGDVLVVDDTWVSGGSAQSTAAALKLAGARRVAVVVLGRHVNPDGRRRPPAAGDVPFRSRAQLGAKTLRVLSPRARRLRHGGETMAPSERTETAMQYALLIYSKPGTVESLSPAEREALSLEYYALRDEPGMLGGAALQPVTTATTIRLADGKPLVTDGPFADTKEVFGGYYLYEADNLDQATEMAARIPALRLGGTIEVRPVMGKAS